MATLLSLQSQIAKLQAQAEALRESEKVGVISRIRDAIDAYQISAEMLGFGGGRAARTGSTSTTTGAGKSPVGVAKYRDPKTGKTWTGRGKPPAWIAGAKNRDAFLIENGAAAAPAATKAARGARGKAKVSNVGVPKYKDPASDKTWTGRGKPPAWIVGVENRDALLIAK